MTESSPSLGTPSRLLAEEAVLRAIVDVLATTMPGAKQRVFDLAHRRLTAAGPKVVQEHAFFARAHKAVDEIMQVTKEHALDQALPEATAPGEETASAVPLPIRSRTPRAAGALAS